MSSNWKESYTGKLRAIVGNQKLIISSIRAVNYDDKNRILFIGDEYQGFELLFRVDAWTGTITQTTDETTNIGFFALDDLPPFETGYWENHEKEVLEDLKHFKGTPIMK